jgi:Spx/MgsR family transcriptional regulator
MLTVYGIPNCDTMKKTFRWLNEHNVPYIFHDYKKQGIDRATLAQWVGELGWEALVNRRGSTWRQLDAITAADLDAERAITLMCQQPSLIKRPLIAHHKRLFLGYTPEIWQTTL